MCEWEVPVAKSATVRSCAECGADLSRWTAKTTQPPPIPVEEVSSDDDGWYFASQAANFSLAAPVIAMGVTWFSRGAVRDSRIGALILGSIIDLLIVSGFILGVIALVRTKKCGREGIFGKAIGGVCINGLFIVGILLTIHLFTKLYIERTNDQQRQRQIQRPW